jgi:hypothetical protein
VRRLDLFVLDAEHRPVALPDEAFGIWVKWMFRHSNCRLADTEVSPGVIVRTLLRGRGLMLFATWLITDYGAQLMRRYRTWDEAFAGHRSIVAAQQICTTRSDPGYID